MQSNDVVSRLGLKGRLADLPWVTVTTGERSRAHGDDVVHSVITADQIAEAFDQRERGLE